METEKEKTEEIVTGDRRNRRSKIERNDKMETRWKRQIEE